MLIVYEDVQTGIRAKHFAESLAAACGSECAAMPLWSTEILSMPCFGDEVAMQAAESDYLIFALRGDSDLSIGIKDWLESWIALAVGGPSCLVALVHPKRNGARSIARDYLRELTQNAGIEFFAHSSSFNGEGSVAGGARFDKVMGDRATFGSVPPRLT